jgi:hypothetical protein
MKIKVLTDVLKPDVASVSVKPESECSKAWNEWRALGDTERNWCSSATGQVVM